MSSSSARTISQDEWETIFYFVPLKDFHALSRTCKTFHNIISTDTFWKALLSNHKRVRKLLNEHDDRLSLFPECQSIPSNYDPFFKNWKGSNLVLYQKLMHFHSFDKQFRHSSVKSFEEATPAQIAECDKSAANKEKPLQKEHFFQSNAKLIQTPSNEQYPDDTVLNPSSISLVPVCSFYKFPLTVQTNQIFELEVQFNHNANWHAVGVLSHSCIKSCVPELFTVKSISTGSYHVGKYCKTHHCEFGYFSNGFVCFKREHIGFAESYSAEKVGVRMQVLNKKLNVHFFLNGKEINKQVIDKEVTKDAEEKFEEESICAMINLGPISMVRIVGIRHFVESTNKST